MSIISPFLDSLRDMPDCPCLSLSLCTPMSDCSYGFPMTVMPLRLAVLLYGIVKNVENQYLFNKSIDSNAAAIFQLLPPKRLDVITQITASPQMYSHKTRVCAPRTLPPRISRFRICKMPNVHAWRKRGLGVKVGKWRPCE